MKRERVFCASCNGPIRKESPHGSWVHVLTDRYGCKDASGNYTGTNARPREVTK